MSARHTTKYAVGRCAFILNDNITSSSSLYAKCKCTCVRTCAWCSCNQEIIFIVSSTKIPGLKFIRAVSRYTNKPYKYVALYPYQSGGGIHASPSGFCKLKSILAFSSQFGSDLWRAIKYFASHWKPANFASFYDTFSSARSMFEFVLRAYVMFFNAYANVILLRELLTSSLRLASL